MEDQEAMDQQRMLNEEAIQEEQRRILEENAQREWRRIQRVEIIQEITDIERERDKTTNKLKRASCQTLTRFNFGVLEDLFVRTAHLNSRIISRINNWEDILETDPEEIHNILL